MIERSVAKSSIPGPDNPANPRMTGRIEFEEQCCLCDRDVPNGMVVLRKKENNRIMCLVCLVDIAQMSQSVTKNE